MKPPFLSTLILFFVSSLSAQIPDSLQQRIRSANNDTSLANAYLLCTTFCANQSDLRLLFLYSDSTIALLNKARKNKTYDVPALEKKRATVLGIRGTAFQMMKKLGAASKAYLEAIAIQKKYGLKNYFIANLNNLGILYYNMNEYVKAENCYKEAMAENKDGKYKMWLSASFHGMATIRMDQEKYAEAEDWVKKALAINEEMKNVVWMAHNYSILQEIRKQEGNKEESLRLLMKNLEISETTTDNYFKSVSASNVGEFYKENGQAEKAIQYFETALNLSRQYDMYDLIQNDARRLMELHQARKDYKNSLDYALILMKANDSLNAFQNREEVYRSEINAEFEGRHKNDSLKMAEERDLNELKLQAKASEIESEKKVKRIMYAGLLVVLLLLIFVYRSYVQKKKANEENIRQRLLLQQKSDELSARQKEILDSIYYARKIQRTLITGEKYIEKALRKLNKRE